MQRPFLFREPNNYWCIYIPYFDELTGKWKRKKKSTKTKNQKEAFKYFHNFKDGNNEEYNPILWSVLCEKYLNISKPPVKSIATHYSIKSVINEFNRYFNDQIINTYTTEEFDKFIQYKIDSTSIHSGKRIQRTLKAIFNQAKKWKMIRANPLDDSIKISIPESDLEFFRAEEFKRLIEYTLSTKWGEFYADIFKFAVGSGLRIKELINLKVSDIDLNQNLIKVESTLLNPTKNKRTDWIDLNEACKKIFMKHSMHGREYLFISPKSGDKVDKRGLQQATKSRILASGLPKNYSFHTFRKTFGKWLLDAGVELKYISKQLRHSSISVTEKWYAKYLPKEYKGYTNVINDFINLD